ncbi:hypothetical protein L2E82_34533 [Cichorium intybus]|uniref:Uncharacterized protein n=1 Tax=Cichorium intybus TaxID=13427 RepID=A0ACB9BMI5_CICIN|nr:hypothetical protein L2E82_34533 [Cichorium intybus]
MVETKRAKIVIPEAVNLGGPAWLDNCLIGEVIDIELLSNFFSIFHNSGIAECSIKYAGGLLVILKFESKEIASAFLTDQRDTWSRWQEMINAHDLEATAPAKQSAKNIDVIEESSIDHLKVVDMPLQGVSCACACAHEQTKNGDLHVFEEPLKSISCARDNNTNSDTFSCANTNQDAGDTFSCARDKNNNCDTFSCANTNQDAGSGSSKLYWADDVGLRSEGGIEGGSGPIGFIGILNGGDNFSPYASCNYDIAPTPNGMDGMEEAVRQLVEGEGDVEVNQ